MAQGGQIYVSTAVALEYEEVRKTSQTISEISQERETSHAPKSALISSKSNSNISARTPRYALVKTYPVGEYKLKGFKTLELVHEVINYYFC